MPQFEYFGPTPGRRPRIGVDGAGNPHMELAPHEVSDPVTYTRPNGDVVEGRTFEVGELFDALDNPDPSRFKEVNNG